MLIQIHHQFKDGKTEMVAQNDIQDEKQLKEYINKLKISHPLPENAIWMWCDERSPHFVWTVKGKEKNDKDN